VETVARADTGLIAAEGRKFTPLTAGAVIAC